MQTTNQPQANVIRAYDEQTASLTASKRVTLNMTNVWQRACVMSFGMAITYTRHNRATATHITQQIYTYTVIFQWYNHTSSPIKLLHSVFFLLLQIFGVSASKDVEERRWITSVARNKAMAEWREKKSFKTKIWKKWDTHLLLVTLYQTCQESYFGWIWCYCKQHSYNLHRNTTNWLVCVCVCRMVCFTNGSPNFWYGHSLFTWKKNTSK